jgi:cell division protein FtsI/penicillin-binding protein 2
MKENFLSRLNITGVLLTVVGLLIIVQMGRVQASSGGRELLEYSNTNIINPIIEVIPERGRIYDRYGHLLAGNRQVYEVGIDLQKAWDPEQIALTLSQLLGMDYNKVLEYAQIDYVPGEREYIRLQSDVDDTVIDELERIDEDLDNRPIRKFLWHREYPPSIDGVVWKPRLERYYPENSLGSNVLGIYQFKDVDNPTAIFGLEALYDLEMAGKPLKIRVNLDPNQDPEIADIPAGASLVMTIDREVQAKMEEILDRGVDNAGAEGGVLVALDPKTGEVLAMATSPRMNLNEYYEEKYWTKGEYFPEGTPFNPIISETYEPGSVYKVLTMATALDLGTVTPETTFTDTGEINVGGAYIVNWDNKGHGPVSMLECMELSLNVCLAWVATQIGPADFYNYMDSFGIGRRTKIDLSGEANFPLSVPGDPTWSDANLGTNAFGQGVAATPIQMASAISAVANQGRIMAPHVVKAIVQNGQQTEKPSSVVGNPIRSETAATLTEMLAVSLENEASSALVEGYRMAGKTGTAEIPTELGYTSSQTHASFVGWGPVDDPRFLVYVWLKKPTTAPWGSVVASPVFSEAAKALTVYLNIPPDQVRHSLQGQ